jgi:hypothetical protein
MCTLMAGLKAEQDKLDHEQEESHGESILTAEIGETIHLTLRQLLEIITKFKQNRY